ncbi:hypothetical protein DICPUDRAFT_93495 [Dictyostelium purpureum]|uniref:Caffeoyl-CoA O-methyltransferase n=1 Tax=Dictyostelium purpureum TaxID=5786 RepID=F0Z857_DICPU|nr:uncharacterized protein DICPUDRAFT_93495 [Dictyostelium purpureum]EGC39872.1 hypothetical protein DICPUDRAFT_93495 [Dictyostelium purpureum]|eukprot:XP_003283623.1 hypothetical protein DICPUDRAFT_93495 [Dictyostelium purpureum]
MLVEFVRKLHSLKNGKVVITKDVINYTNEKSEPICEIQKELIKYTNENFSDNYMITDIGQNQLFSLLLKVLNAKKVIDVGVYTGLSSLSFALSLPEDGKVYGLDNSSDYIDCCNQFWKKAGVSDKINLIIDDAKKTLQQLIEQGECDFDFIFIDADKLNYCEYYELALKLIRKGGIIAFDNVLFFGSTVVDENDKDDENQIFFENEAFQELVTSIKKLNDKISKDERVIKTMLPLSDGITLITKK